MGFFDDLPQHRVATPRRHPWDPPENAIPTPVSLSLTLGRSDHAHLVLLNAWCYPTGADLFIRAALRNPPAELSSRVGRGLRLGVRFANGARAANLGLPVPADQPKTGPWLIQLALGATARSRDWRFWLCPLPPPGPVTVVCDWTATGIPETRTTLDASLLLTAATHSTIPWPPT